MPFTPTTVAVLIGSSEISLTRSTTGSPAAYLAGTLEATSCGLQIDLLLSDLALGDEFELIYYRKLGSASVAAFLKIPLVGPADPRILPTVQMADGWEVTLRKVSGTDRTITYTLHRATADSTATIADAIWDEPFAGHVAAGSFGAIVQAIAGYIDTEVASIKATVEALPSAASVASAVFAHVYEGAAIFSDFVKDAAAVLTRDGFDLTTNPKFKDSSGATRVTMTMGGSGATRTRS